MWRGWSIYFSTKSRSETKEDAASCLANRYPSRASWSFLYQKKKRVLSFSSYYLCRIYQAMRIPFPPPPAEAFNITGYPISCAKTTDLFQSNLIKQNNITKCQCFLNITNISQLSRNNIHASTFCKFFWFNFVTHGSHGLIGWPDEDNAVVCQQLRKGGVLRQESKAWQSEEMCQKKVDKNKMESRKMSQKRFWENKKKSKILVNLDERLVLSFFLQHQEWLPCWDSFVSLEAVPKNDLF